MNRRAPRALAFAASLCAALVVLGAGDVANAPAASSPTEIRIGYFGPDDGDDPIAGDLWLATRLAVEEANAEGGYRGIPFRLLPVWSEDPWGTGVANLVRQVYTDDPRAIIGSMLRRHPKSTTSNGRPRRKKRTSNGGNRRLLTDSTILPFGDSISRD